MGGDVGGHLSNRQGSLAQSLCQVCQRTIVCGHLIEGADGSRDSSLQIVGTAVVSGQRGVGDVAGC